MMIKKQLSVLAGSVMVAAGANAAIDLVEGGEALAIFNSIGGGSYYQLITGSSADSLAAGTGFNLDISTAAGLLGSIDNFAVIGLTTGVETYNYTEFLYVNNGGGLVYTGSAPAPSTNLSLVNAVNDINLFLDNANLGLNGEGSLGDFDSAALVAPYLVSGLSSLVINEATLGGVTASALVTITSPVAAVEGVYLDGTTLNATSAVPVPAAAWLFGSALLGLGVIRRKR